ncbi:energy-coupling factor transport system ATP-binding protein [Bifidobacterium commune]|uniref:Energy-coupling factor transport system ATP-binding protein n=1 Tax=Bifidobacterium commune TaxID=1505727 RepID=A0A1C4H235_9BIFI|nr:ATP-binding cassette domain-containing protein [Bifidobacterium commune]MBB2954724.1 energy-coupling factor transport system ATP-binding protein [Bifidobacterium commune]SCC78640.1 energy-coupling factor transport system ATP-binding protein [Bifidobacterium commune]
MQNQKVGDGVTCRGNGDGGESSDSDSSRDSTASLAEGNSYEKPFAEVSPSSIRFVHWGYRHASRRHFAVRGLDLDIRAGEHVLLLGASGIGKSTILEGASGLLGDQITANGVPTGQTSNKHVVAVEDSEGGITEGSILVDGIPAVSARGRVGLVLQDPDAQMIFERLGDNVAFGPENMGVPRPEIWHRVEQSLSAVGLQGLQLYRSTMHLSGGQMQRLALAGVLAMQPGALLLDEPTANLDPEGVKQVVGAVRDALERSETTMLLVEHRAGPWIDLIDRVIVLGPAPESRAEDTVAREDGGSDFAEFRRTVVVADGTPDEVFGDRRLDFADLGIWVPERYRRPEDVIRRIRNDEEPDSDPACGDGTTLLSTKDLAIGRDGTAIARNIDISFASEQITAFVGHNGVGKSTLSLTLAGLLRPVSGNVEASQILTKDASGGSPIGWTSTQLASRISYVFQNPEHQFARGSVLEEVMLGPLRTGMNEEEAREKALGLLRRFGLCQYATVNPYTLSGGEKRRLTVAASLAAAPKIIVLDEPTFGQDRRTWMQIVSLIHSLRGDGVSVIVVTHDRDLVTALGARVVELRAVSHVEEVAARPVTQALSASDTSLTDKVGRQGLDHNVGVTQNGTNATQRDNDEWDSGVLSETVTVSPVCSRDEKERQSSRSTVLASLNPTFRLFGGFIAAVPLILSLDCVSSGLALLIEFILFACIGLSPWRVVKSTWPVFIGAPGSALAVLLYGKEGGRIWWHWAMITVTDRSSLLALATGIRILAVGIPAIIAVLGVETTDLADSFSQILHLPDRFVYGGLAGMRLFAVLRDDWYALAASRRSRGLGDENKIKAFFPQTFALLVLSIRRSTTLATAMEARGFGGKNPRTHARVSRVNTRDWLFVIVCAAVPTLSLIVAAFAGTFTFFGG